MNHPSTYTSRLEAQRDELVTALAELIEALDREHHGELDCDSTAAINRVAALAKVNA